MLGRKTGGRAAGTPNRATAEIRAAAQLFGAAAIERLAQLAGLAVDDAGNPVPGAESEAIQVIALKELLDRGYGKATQPVEDDRDVPIVYEVHWADAVAEPPAKPVIEARAEPEPGDTEAGTPLLQWGNTC